MFIRQATILLLLFIVFQISIGQSLNLAGNAYERHNELQWSPVTQADRYQIWKKEAGDTDFVLAKTTSKTKWLHWTGVEPSGLDPIVYFIKALNVPGTVLEVSDTISLLQHMMSDDEFLDMVQRYTFRYFYDYAHPISGMARERYNSNDVVTTGGSGFGVMAILVGVERGYITREEGLDHILKMVSFLQFADRFHGVFPHWMNGKTGDVIPFSTFDNGGDLVETSFMMEGLLCARTFFDQDSPKEDALRTAITGLWEEVEWDFYTKNNSGVLYWHWSPQYAWQMNFPIRGYNEALIIYLLAVASPTHSVDASYYHNGWAGGNYVNGNSWYGHKLFVGPHLGGPLFFAHYSFMGFDPRGIRDAYCNYFIQNQNHTRINRDWCITNPFHFEDYGEDCWGLTASDDPWGYLAHAPGSSADNGTITPAAGIPSMPYTPEESISLLKNLYRTYGEKLWGEYGFYDAFNPKENWFADSYLAIDQGPIINMIENYRSGILWSLFMSNAEIQPALDAIGFMPDSAVSYKQPSVGECQWTVSPTVNDGVFTIDPGTCAASSVIRAELVDISGRKFPLDLSDQINAGNPAEVTVKRGLSGLFWVVLTTQNGFVQAQPVLLR